MIPPAMKPTPCAHPVRLLLAAFLVLGLAAACVTEDVATGQNIPRGDQKYPFARVEDAAKDLAVGQSKMQVLLMLGSPAEKSDNGDVWVYLPERYAILIPAKALRLEFHQDKLADFGFQPIVLGARL